jgi:hypothetical protein
MHTKLLGTALLGILILAGCQPNKTENQEEANVNNDVTDVGMNAEISIEKFEDSPPYTSASLQLDNPKTSSLAQGGDVDFAFEVGDYELGMQTPKDGTAALLANSDKGQHIHLIVDNDPYSAHYEPTFKYEMSEGTHYVVAFLSRSYHESVKNTNSFIAKKIVVGNASDDMGVNLEEPTLIYSRPKGEYSGRGTDNLLLDFFLLNTTLSETGNKVLARINGKEFMISEWAPYVIKGLPKGEVSIQLELVDVNGDMIPGGFNNVTRKVMLKD